MNELISVAGRVTENVSTSSINFEEFWFKRYRNLLEWKPVDITFEDWVFPS